MIDKIDIMNASGNRQDPIANDTTVNKEFSDELTQPIWSVISFDRHESAGMSYDQAVQKLAELETKGVAGLCVVTDDTAVRIGKD